MAKKKLTGRLLSILFYSYLLLIIGMFLGVKVFPISWVFILFIVSAVVFYKFKIDPRFLIIPAIPLLALCPLLLIAGKDVLANSIAIYAFYFLIIGLSLQFIEMVRKRTPDFSNKELQKIPWMQLISRKIAHHKQ